MKVSLPVIYFLLYLFFAQLSTVISVVASLMGFSLTMFQYVAATFLHSSTTVGFFITRNLIRLFLNPLVF